MDVGVLDEWQVARAAGDHGVDVVLDAARLGARANAQVAVAVVGVERNEQDLGALRRGDARQREYRLTRSGREVMRRLSRKRSQAIASIWNDFDSRDLAGFVRFSNALAGRLESYAERHAS